MSENETKQKTSATDCWTAWTAYAAELNGIGAELRQGLERAYTECVRSSQQALTSTDVQDKLQEACKRYGRVLEDLLKELRLEERFQAAYSTYVQALQAALAKADPDELTPELLFWIANTMLWAAYWRCSGVGRWYIAGTWGWDPGYIVFARCGPASEEEKESQAA